ncbi:hypothetical protein Mal15_27920 [Stieleria maiorica]|uniref:Uncharacterized protein n=1 Tax=Stieleria maiorica TaxID=2795974 RepID=A0A5B9MIA7_9BACT|nr:hypothetical protein [Stieleria maiorica]QEF98737.1 hypothetical protein Mal15_27920 [Stieleria maiorica]
MAIRSVRAASAPEHHPIPSGSNTETSPPSPSDRGLRSQRHRAARARLKTRGRLRSIVIAGTAAVMLASTSGCSLVSNAYRQIRKAEYLDDFMLAHRNKVFATKAWLREKHCHKNRPHLSEFKAGFIEGYIDVANGSNGCIPSIAPSQYWGWKYQSPGGQAAIDAWFAGYPLGVKAAEQDGVGFWSRAPVMAPASQTAGTTDPAAMPTEAETVLGPDGKPIPPEIIVPGSTRIIETTTPIDSMHLEPLAPPVAEPAIEGAAIEGETLSIPAIGDDASLQPGTAIPHGANEFSGAIESATLVPRKSAATYSLEDLSSATRSLGDDAVEGIFGSIEMPATQVDAGSQANASHASSGFVIEGDAVAETASTESDPIPFKFE